MTVELLRAPASPHETPDWVDLTDPAERERLSPAAVRGVIQLARVWELPVASVTALLGEVPVSTWHAWKKAPPKDLGVDRLTRISYLLGIFAAVRLVFPEEIRDTWVRRPNTNDLFGGRTPLDVMERGGIPALLAVRQLLDGYRGGL